MARKDKERDKSMISVDDISKNSVFEDIYGRISSNTYKKPMDNIKQIDALDNKIQDILSGDIGEMKNETGDNLSMFLSKTLANNDKANTGSINKLNNSGDFEVEAFFNNKDGAFEIFNQRFRNKLLLYNDLEIISEQLVEINEALNTTRDDIVCSDEVGSDIARSLNFVCETEDSDEYGDLINEVKRLEKELHLNTKIKEHIVPKTLKYGEYFVYIIPESELFKKTQVNKYKTKTGITLEASELSSLQESLTVENPNKDEKRLQPDTVQPDTSEILSYIQENIHVCNENIALPLLENENVASAYGDLVQFNKLDSILKPKKSKKKKDKEFNVTGFSDGVKPTNKVDEWNDVKGCYIKLLDPKKVIPVKIMDYIIGYYYINDMDFQPGTPSARPGQQFTTMFNGNIMNAVASKSGGERNVINTLATSIIKSFDKKYLENNKEFKDLIINSLMYNDLYKRKLHYQFIPADYICRFTVNEDENGNGQSMLWKSLFYAKLYLSILVFNVITYLSKSQDTRIHYIKQSGIDKNAINKTMKIARQIKEKQISIADIMDYSAIFGKLGTGRDVFMPVGEQGERGIEFDVISGQNVDMQNEFMEQLKHSYISGTGVPSVLSTYINEIDFAKTLVMANAKHMRRVMHYQDSFNDGLTRMYKMIMLYSTDISPERISEFEYKLSRPKTLPNNNMVDMLSYGDQLLDFFIKSEYGEYGDDPDENIAKDLFRSEMAREVLGVLPWELVDEVKEKVMLELAKRKAEKETDTTADTGGDDDSNSWQ